MHIHRLLAAAVIFSVLLGAASPARAQTPSSTNDPIATLKEKITSLETRIAEMSASKQRIEQLEKSLADINARLGQNFGQPTSFNSFERRLQQLERDLDQLKRRVDRLERQK